MPTLAKAPAAPIRGMAQKVEKWAAEGWSKRAVARGLGVSVETLNRWMEDHPRIRDAWYAGREEEHRELHGVLMREAKAGNMTAVIFALKTRHEYREHAPIASDTAPRVTINLPGAMAPDAFRAMKPAGRVIDHAD